MENNYVCSLPDCTISTTGKCLKSYIPVNSCPNIKLSTPVSGTVDEVSKVPVEKSEVGVRFFHSGNEMGTEEANLLMRSNYVHLIGVLGSTNAGKTCFLTSFYIILTLGILPRYLFAGSETLWGFENRARGLRKWKNGALPDQLVPHTELQDVRNPSLMHIAMVRTDDPTRKKINLLLTDLPGEWSDTLIDRAETANRFNFLRRADGIIIMIDGPILAAPSTRHVEIQKMTVLLGRLGNNIHVDLDIPMVLLLTKADEIDMVPPPGLKTIEHAARDLGFSPVTIMSIAFSRKPKNFTSGVGIIETIDAIIDIDYPISVDRVERQFSNDARSFTSFRHLELKEG